MSHIINLIFSKKETEKKKNLSYCKWWVVKKIRKAGKTHVHLNNWFETQSLKSTSK